MKHIPNHVIRIRAGNSGCFITAEVLDTLSGLYVDLDVFERTILMRELADAISCNFILSYCFGELVGVATIGVQKAN